MRLIDETAYQYKIAKIPMEERTFVRAWETAQNMPTIDAVPVVRGEWIRIDETQALLSVEWKCSQCGQEIRVDGILTAIGAGWKYCPNCGAKMDKGVQA